MRETALGGGFHERGLLGDGEVERGNHRVLSGGPVGICALDLDQAVHSGTVFSKAPQQGRHVGLPHADRELSDP
ncbi:hypothetical protein CIP100161_01647 [Corynebacterium diphtheriae]|nr:hypothetical protein CIP100161_01647 [Corynebacterium diphtheriae]